MKLLICGESVYDGSGCAPSACRILAEDGIVADVQPGPAGDFSASDFTVIRGKIVCPGFIDIHRHADSAVFCLPGFGKTELLQGITSVVSGNCGLSPVPGNHRWRDEYYRYLEPVTGLTDGKEFAFGDFHGYRKELEKLSLPVNFGFLAGAGAIRTAVKGFSKLPFSHEEMRAAKDLIRQAFDAGALGLSFGLMYQPECYSGPDELVEFARSAGEEAGTILCFHMRGEGDSLVESIDEVIHIAGESGLPANISHFKATGIKNWRNLVYRAIEKIETARSRGLKITADFYPYNGGSTTILSLIPPRFQEGGIEAMCARLTDKNEIDLLRREVGSEHSGWDNMALSIGWDRIIISSAVLPEHQAYCGRTVEAIAREEGYADPAELLAELAASEQGRVGIITFSMDQNDIDTIAGLPWTCLISDSLYSNAGRPHPRLNGAFPKFLREYVREKHMLTMEQAIHKMTGMPAQRMGIKNRGILCKGSAADILVFDPEKFRDNADYANPSALASGLDAVILNGKIVYQNGKFNAPNGQVLSSR